MRLITLTTDFGTRDWFVGTMKGVILGINPRATIVDITQDISSGDIRAGAFALVASCRYFPKGTVHVAVVDPGVGGARKAIAVQTADYFFIGPDNGVLSLALMNEKIKAIHRLESKEFFLKEISHTFHGRDIFAPVAAHLSKGVAIQKFGPRTEDYAKLPWPTPKPTGQTIRGQVVCIDRFGNAITNLPNHLITREGGACSLSVGRKAACPVKPFYQSMPKGRLVAVPGSTGFLEIAINGGSAAKVLRVKTGDGVTMKLR